MNILGEVSQPVIIDWPDARRGDPAADVCRSYLLMKLHAAEIAMTYLDAYCRISGMARQTVLSWLPYVAAAKLAEDVPSELDGLQEAPARCVSRGRGTGSVRIEGTCPPSPSALLHRGADTR